MEQGEKRGGLQIRDKKREYGKRGKNRRNGGKTVEKIPIKGKRGNDYKV